MLLHLTPRCCDVLPKVRARVHDPSVLLSRQDTRAVEEVLQDCRNRGVASLVITNFDGGMFRYPFGLRGNHGMFGLRTLYLDQNRILELPRDFYKLTNLTDVRLNANRILDIRAEVRNLVGLQLFWVHQNLLRAVPMSIGELTNLVQLSLDDNQIATIPPQVANITSLQVAPCPSHVPAYFCSFPALAQTSGAMNPIRAGAPT